MTRAEVELISFSISIDGQYAVKMKFYKDGTTCRYGTGELPQLETGGISKFDNADYFDKLISKVPDDVLQYPVYYEESTPNGYDEYVMAFFGKSINGETGEYANWAKVAGIRLKLDHHTTFRHPVMPFLNELTKEAIELTNEWYFDIVLNARYNAQSSALPEKTSILKPKRHNAICNEFDVYLSQMTTSAGQWKLTDFSKDKTYLLNSKAHQLQLEETGQACKIEFKELHYQLIAPL